MHSAFAASGGASAVPIHLVTADTWAALRGRLTPAQAAFAEATGFEPKAGRHALLPGESGIAGVLFAVDAPGQDERDPFLAGKLPGLLPPGIYRLDGGGNDARLAALAF